MVQFLTVPELVESAASRFGRRPALIAPGHQESFAELAAATDLAAAAMRDAGAQPGERVLLLARNSIPAVHAWLGAIAAGAMPAAVNPELTLSELRYLGDDLRPVAVVHDADRSQVAVQLAGELRRPRLALDELAERRPALGRGEADPLGPAAIVYTSGTTSRPKGVLVRHAAYTETGRSFPSWIGLGGEERLWACLPLFHINAQAYSLMSSLAHGYGLAVSESFHASSFWREARELQVTSVNVIGAMLEFLDRQPLDAWVESALRAVYAAPAPAPDRRRELEARFHVRISGGYGMSENTFGCAESATSRHKPGSIGRPRQPVTGEFTNELRISTAGGGEAAVGEAGELWFSNPVMSPGYWNAADVTARTFVEGWMRTGDGGYRDAEGDVFLTGRLKEMIRRRGENIAPAEVEDALLEHTAVAAAAVFGIPSGVTEEEVAAAVVLVAGRSIGADELRAFARERLAAYKVPSAIVFLDSLPMTATMRVSRQALRQQYLGGSGRAGGHGEAAPGTGGV